jgi:hypothetical protein
MSYSAILFKWLTIPISALWLGITPAIAAASELLLGATVAARQNQVQLHQANGFTRPVRNVDWVGDGDTVLTEPSASIDLQFNEGTFVRAGEFTQLSLVANSRTFQVQRGTVLVVPAEAADETAIATPNLTITTPNATVIVRYIPPASPLLPFDPLSNPTSGSGRTAVMVVANRTESPVTLQLSAKREIRLGLGQMAIVNDATVYVFEFDLGLFYQTSSLIRGENGSLLSLMGQSAGEAIAPPTIPSSQTNFQAQYIINPRFLSPEALITNETNWLFLATPPPTVSDESTPDPSPDSTTSTDTAVPADQPPPTD